jgi:seryl-tRNA synthetase
MNDNNSDTTPTPPRAMFAHTLNATAAAIPRIIVALIENGAEMDDGGKVVSVRLPSVLKAFWLGGGEHDGTIRWG